jgi:TolB protein
MQRIPVLSLLFAALAAGADRAPAVGQFEGQTDIGASLRPGSAGFDAATGAYTVTGGGLNMWANADAFHFVWKKLAGDFAIAAEVRIVTGTDGNPHRKAGLVIRQGLEPEAPYIDVVLHGEGLTAMQFRAAPGGATDEVRSPVSAPEVLRLERHGDVFEMWVAAAPGEPMKKAGSTTLALHDPVYAGLAVCAHDAGRMETAVFTNVKIESAPGVVSTK